MRLPLSEQPPLLIKIKPLIYQFISEEIRYLRKRKGLTGIQLGKILHLSQQQISRYENGRNLIPLDMLLLMLFVLEESPTYFLQRLSGFVDQITETIDGYAVLNASLNAPYLWGGWGSIVMSDEDSAKFAGSEFRDARFAAFML